MVAVRGHGPGMVPLHQQGYPAAARIAVVDQMMVDNLSQDELQGDNY